MFVFRAISVMIPFFFGCQTSTAPTEIDTLDHESFALNDEEVSMPQNYDERFEVRLLDFITAPNQKYAITDKQLPEDPELNFDEDQDPIQSMAMFDDTQGQEFQFFVKRDNAKVFILTEDKRKVVKLLKKGQRFQAQLENGKAKIGSRFYISLDDLGLSQNQPTRNVRN